MHTLLHGCFRILSSRVCCTHSWHYCHAVHAADAASAVATSGATSTAAATIAVANSRAAISVMPSDAIYRDVPRYVARFVADDAPDWNAATFVGAEPLANGLSVVDLDVEVRTPDAIHAGDCATHRCVVADAAGSSVQLQRAAFVHAAVCIWQADESSQSPAGCCFHGARGNMSGFQCSKMVYSLHTLVKLLILIVRYNRLCRCSLDA